MTESIRYLPSDLVQLVRMEMRSRASRDVDPDDPMGAWAVERLCERAFAVGYQEAFTRGYEAGWNAANDRQKEENKAEVAPKAFAAVSE